MTTKINKYILLFCGFFFALFNKATAQDQWLLHLESLHQSYINPAFQPTSKLEISLPSFGFDVNTNGLNIGAAINKNDAGVNVVSLGTLAKNMQDLQKFNSHLNVNTFDVALKLKSFNVMLGHAFVNSNSFILDKDLVNLAASGNAPYINQTLDLDVVGTSTTYNQIYLGASKKIGKLGLGLKVKYLNGWYDARSEASKIQLTTSDDYYQIKVKNDIDIQSSGMISFGDSNPGDIKNISFNTDITSSKNFFTSNSGVGLDLGLTYDINENIMLMASVTDIGSINWKENVVSLTNQKNTELIGVNLKDIIDGQGTENTKDSLYGAFKLNTNNASYSAPINAIFNAGISYRMNDYMFSSVFSSQSYIDQNKYNLSLQASKKIGKNILIGLSYTIKNNSYNNVGLLVNAKYGRVNIFGASQNILGLTKSREINGLNGRVGLSFVLLK